MTQPAAEAPGVELRPRKFGDNRKLLIRSRMMFMTTMVTIMVVVMMAVGAMAVNFHDSSGALIPNPESPEPQFSSLVHDAILRTPGFVAIAWARG